MANTRSSNCSSGVEVDLYWRECSAPERDTHIDRIVDEVFEKLQAPNREWNPWNRTAVKGKIRSLIRRAASGELEPLDHVKSLRGGVGDLFEIRFKDLAISRRENGVLVGEDTQARLIHVEPLRISMGAIGLLAFEKPKGVSYKQEQDEYIDQAVVLEATIRDRNWGITLRSPQ